MSESGVGLGVARHAIAAEVRAEAARQRVTQMAVAQLLETSQGSVSRKMLGKSPFDAEELYLLAAAWDVPVTRFMPDPSAVRRQGLEPRTR